MTGPDLGSMSWTYHYRVSASQLPGWPRKHAMAAAAVHGKTLMEDHSDEDCQSDDCSVLHAGLESSRPPASGEGPTRKKPPGWAVSFPPLVAWSHVAEPEEGTPEAQMLQVLRQPRCWVS